MDSILIVKTSAIGDVVQSFGVLEYLRARFPSAKLDWVVEKGSSSLLLAHPYLSEVKIMDSKKWRKSPFARNEREEMRAFVENLQTTDYDVLFDLQGNTKSGLVDFFSKAKIKVGFGKNSVTEKLNLLFTDRKIEVDSSKSVYHNYLHLVKEFFSDTAPFHPQGVCLRLSEAESARLKAFLSLPAVQRPVRLMLALGSNWENKRISANTAEEFLNLINKHHKVSFVVVYSNETEKTTAERLVRAFPDTCVAIGEMSLPFWQALMMGMSGVVTMDSAALHIAATAGVPTFSLFGPSSSRAYKPEGERHYAIQGACPYGRSFNKRCPVLRTCNTGACIKSFDAQALYEQFSLWSGSLQDLEGSQNRCVTPQPQ